MEQFSDYSDYIDWFRQIKTTINPMSEQEFYQSSRYLSSQNSKTKRDQKTSGIKKFSEYQEYLEWFALNYPNSKPLNRENFYQSSRYKRKFHTIYKEDEQTQSTSTLNLTVKLEVALSEASSLLINDPDNHSTD